MLVEDDTPVPDDSPAVQSTLPTAVGCPETVVGDRIPGMIIPVIDLVIGRQAHCFRALVAYLLPRRNVRLGIP